MGPCYYAVEILRASGLTVTVKAFGREEGRGFEIGKSAMIYIPERCHQSLKSRSGGCLSGRGLINCKLGVACVLTRRASFLCWMPDV